MSPKKQRPFTAMGDRVNQLLQTAEQTLAESHQVFTVEDTIEERQLLALQSIATSLVALIHIQTGGDLL